MPPLGNPSAISYSRSSARSDLKIFTFPLASYNFRMRAICDVSDMRTFLRLMLMAHLSLGLMLMAHSGANRLRLRRGQLVGFIRLNPEHGASDAMHAYRLVIHARG